MNIKILSIRNCAACGKDHPHMQFTELDAPEYFKDHEFNYVAKCPDTGIDVYLATVTEKEAKK